MIDIRSHILDGTACGPATFAESVEMCRAAAHDGVRKLVATPFWETGCEEPPLPFAEIDRKIANLSKEVGGAVVIKTGFVLEFGANLPGLLDRYRERLALGGKHHLLISLPKTHMPANASEVWLALAGRGFSVVISGPECSPVLRRNPAALSDWSRVGVKLQLDAASVAGAYGREVQKFALDCLRRYEGRVAVASNACGGRDTTLSQARGELAECVGARGAHKVVNCTPLAMLGETDPHEAGKSKSGGHKLARLFRSLQPVRAILG